MVVKFVGRIVGRFEETWLLSMPTVNSFKAVGGFRKVGSSRVTAHQPQVVVPVRLNRPINPLIRCFLSETSEFRPSSPLIPFPLNVQRTRLLVSFRFFSLFRPWSQTCSDSFLFRYRTVRFPILLLSGFGLLLLFSPCASNYSVL